MACIDSVMPGMYVGRQAGRQADRQAGWRAGGLIISEGDRTEPEGRGR